MDPGPNAGSGAEPAEDRDGLSDKATIALLKRRLMEAEHNVQQWKEQAEEARTELVKSKSNAKVLQAELENTLRELAQARGEALTQGGLASSSKQPAEVEQTRAVIDGVKVDKVAVFRNRALTRQLNQELSMSDRETPQHRSSIAEQTDKEQLDYAIAKQLDYELNRKNKEAGTAGEFTVEAGETSQHVHRSSKRSVTSNPGNGSPESQLEKATAKNQALKKKLDDMEATAYHYQKLHHQEHSEHVGTYNQARMLEMEINSAREHIQVQDEELKSVRNELEKMNELKEELGSFLGRWNTRVGLLPVSEDTSPSPDE